MSILRRAASLSTAEGLIAQRLGLRTGSHHVSRERALRHSAVWACQRLRADLISTMPVDVFRRVEGVQIEAPKPMVLRSPGGESVDVLEWLYSTQVDLDATGNAFGLIVARDGFGLPSRIDLVPVDEVTVVVRKGVVSYRVNGREVPTEQVWHERQFTTSGSPVGLSPVGHAALSLSGFLNAQEFAAAWFSKGGIPAAHLRNTAKTITAEQSQAIKARFEATVETGGLFVTGNDWEYEMISAKASEAAVIDQLRFGVADAARFFGVPGDMIDGESSTGSITYANVTQRNLQLLIMNIGPAVTRRERALSRLVATPRYVKLNTDALLRMDLKSRYEAHRVAIASRFMAPSEVRELENRQPFTPEQEAEFERLKPPTTASGTSVEQGAAS